jgi:hypothetical protein
MDMTAFSPGKGVVAFPTALPSGFFPLVRAPVVM